MPSLDAKQEQRATYLTLIGLFLALFVAFSARASRRRDNLELKPFDLVLLGLATYRAGHMAAYDKVTEPLRRPFTKTKPDHSGTGETVVPRGAGARRALGELVSCPSCIGTWIAAGLVYGLRIAPRPTRAFLAIMSAVGAADLLRAAAEALNWTGRSAREEAGVFLRAREQ